MPGWVTAGIIPCLHQIVQPFREIFFKFVPQAFGLQRCGKGRFGIFFAVPSYYEKESVLVVRSNALPQCVH